MELQRKLKQDYEFYSHFTESVRQFQKKEDNYLCEVKLYYQIFTIGLIFLNLMQAWVQKLTGEPYFGIGNQYNRNIFLANLVVCIQKGKLTGPFIEYPPDYGLPNATDIFGCVSAELKVRKLLFS